VRGGGACYEACCGGEDRGGRKSFEGCGGAPCALPRSSRRCRTWRRKLRRRALLLRRSSGSGRLKHCLNWVGNPAPGQAQREGRSSSGSAAAAPVLRSTPGARSALTSKQRCFEVSAEVVVVRGQCGSEVVGALHSAFVCVPGAQRRGAIGSASINCCHCMSFKPRKILTKILTRIVVEGGSSSARPYRYFSALGN
jgi:hypothetical protein